MNSQRVLLVVLLLFVFQIQHVEISAGWKYQNRQTADFNEGSLPSHLPSPPKPKDLQSQSTPSPNGPVGPATFGGMQLQFTDGTQNQLAQTQEVVEESTTEVPTSAGPLGLGGTILILVPEFKYTIYRLPKWFGATVKLSFPITIFFELLAFPPNSPQFPFPFGPWVPRGQNRRHSFHRRGSVGTWRGKRSVLSLPPPESMRGGERAFIFPRLESFLRSAGINGGRECLLRAVCEVHETSLTDGYGLLGDMITLLFSISRSSYADSHLPEYLKAEETGKSGDCSHYYLNCTHSIFGVDKEDSPQQCEVLNGENFCDE